MTGRQVTGLLPVIIDQHGIAQQWYKAAHQHNLGFETELDILQTQLTGKLADLVQCQLVCRQAHQCDDGKLQ